MNLLRKNILLFLLVAGFTTPQQKNAYQRNFPNPKFEYLNIMTGLPNNTIRAINQDRFGYLWFGTSNGLVKYDGYTMKVLRPNKDDTTSITNREIRNIYCDQFGSLWIGTYYGLELFDYKTESFKHYLELKSIAAVCEDSLKSLWVGTDNELYMFYQDTKEFKNFAVLDSTCIIYDLTEYIPGKTILLATNQGLKLFDPTKKKFNTLKSKNLDLGSTYTLFKGNDSRLWIGCDRGLVSLNPSNDEIKLIVDIGLPVRVIAQDATDFLWCYAGSQVWATTGNKMIHFDSDSYEHKVVNSDIIMSMYKDNSGILWLGTGWEGLLKWDKNKWKFNSYKNPVITNHPEKDNYVWKIYIDKNDILWLGTKNGLDKIDRKTGRTNHYNFNNNEIKVIHDDGSGYLWLGTLKQGLIRFDPKTENVKYFSYDPNDSTSLSSNHVFCILTDLTGTMWIGTRYDGLNRFYKRTENFKRYKSNLRVKGSLSNNEIFDMSEDSDGFIWIATLYGVDRFNQINDSFTAMKKEEVDPILNNATSVFEDSKGNLWLSTFFNGLNLFDKEKLLIVKNYTEKDGLAQNTIANIREDNFGNLWIKTFNGISKFNPQTETFRNYDASDGLPKDMTRAFYTFQNTDGEIYFGSTNGYFSFYPDSITDDPVPPKVIISNLSLFNRENEALNYDGFITEMKEINLPYNHNDLRFDFAALHFGEPSKNKYKYFLENFDDDWVDAGTQRNATYTNLSPGEYTFRVIACNRDGVWNEEGASLKVIISPPFWATWWAYGIYVILFGSILYGIRKYEMNRLNLKNQVKLDEVQLKEKEETDRMKSRFFANISHEFRTPLTLILGPAEKITPGLKDDDIQRQTGLIKRNATLLLSLVNQLLDLSKLEAGKLKLQASKGNIVSFVKGVIMSFESLAERKGIQLNFISEKDEIELYFDKDKLAKILTNLLSNAFKFTDEGGAITVALTTVPSPQERGMSVRQGDGKVEISVNDTGIGISVEELPKLFDRFYQVDSSQTREHEGTGIGLALTKELVELHKGNIKVKSVVGKGSEFIVELPIGRNHLKDDEVVKEIVSEDTVILIPDEIGMKNLTDVISENLEPDSTSRAPQNDSRDGEDKTLILVVEDNADVRAYIKDSLGNNFQIEEAENGESGVEKAKEIIPDLIISDIMMPKMDGNELTRRIKNDERTSHIPVILLTAKSEQESKLEGLETGADDYLTKPFDTKELQVRIKNLIHLRKKLQEKFSKGDLSWQQDRKKLSTLDENFMNKVNEVIENHFAEEDFSIEDFNNEIGMGKIQIYRKLKALTGKSPSRYIRLLRLKRAKQMIKEKQGNISEIAYSVGFSSPQYFARCFKEEFGYAPSEQIQ